MNKKIIKTLEKTMDLLIPESKKYSMPRASDIINILNFTKEINKNKIFKNKLFKIIESNYKKKNYDALDIYIKLSKNNMIMSKLKIMIVNLYFSSPKIKTRINKICNFKLKEKRFKSKDDLSLVGMVNKSKLIYKETKK